MTYEEIKAMQKRSFTEYLNYVKSCWDTIDFEPYFEDFEDIDDLRLHIRCQDWSNTIFDDECWAGDPLNFATRNQFINYLRERYGDRYAFNEQEVDPPVYIYKRSNL